MKLHCCLLDRDCRMAGLVWRIHLITAKSNIGVALLSRSKFADRYPDRARWVHWVRHPR